MRTHVPLLFVVAGLPLVASGADIAPLTREQAVALVRQVVERPGSSPQSYNASIRVVRAAGLEPRASDPAVAEAMKAVFEQPASPNRLFVAIAGVRTLRVPALVPTLIQAAERDEVVPWIRRYAVVSALVLDPQGSLPGRWIKDVVDSRSFRTWEEWDRIDLIGLLALLPPDEAMARAQSIERWADEEGLGPRHSIRGTLDRMRSAVEWGREVEAMPRGGQAQAIVEDGLWRGHAALRLSIEPERRPLVVAEVHRRLADGIDGQEPWLLGLLDELGETMSAEEFAVYQATTLTLCTE